MISLDEQRTERPSNNCARGAGRKSKDDGATIDGPLMLVGHNDGRKVALGTFLGDVSNGDGWEQQLHGSRGRFVYVSSAPADKRDYIFTHGGGGIPGADDVPLNCCIPI